MSDQLFDALFHLLNSRQHDGFNILLLLVVFLNFKKRSVSMEYVSFIATCIIDAFDFLSRSTIRL